MKKMGRTTEPLTVKQTQAVTEYLNSNLSLIEVAEKYETTKSGLAYWLKKYRKEQELNAKEDKRGETKLN
jgi:predicted DNA-binding protein YlxM (UPF0122 family)